MKYEVAVSKRISVALVVTAECEDEAYEIADDVLNCVDVEWNMPDGAAKLHPSWSDDRVVEIVGKKNEE